MTTAGIELRLIDKASPGIRRTEQATQKLTRTVNKSQKGLKGLGNAARGSAIGVGVLNKALAVTALYLAPLAIAGKVFGGFAEADKAAAAVETLGVNSKDLRNQLKRVSIESGHLSSTTALMGAAYDVASAGFNKASEASAVLEASLKGAVGGMSDIKTVSDATTSVLNAYGLSSNKAQKIVDGFIQTQNDGKIIVEQYANQIGRVAPIAAAAGVSIDELNAAISAVTATGVPVMSTFAGLRQALVAVLKPTKEAQDVAAELGIEFNAAALESKGFAAVMKEISQKVDGDTEKLTKLFGSVESLTAITPLLNDGLKQFDINLLNQANSAGVADAAVKKMGNTVSSQISRILNGVGNLARELDTFLGPVLKDILGTTNDIIASMTNMLSLMSDANLGGAYQQLTKSSLTQGFGLGGIDDLNNIEKAVAALNPELATTEAQVARIRDIINKFENLTNNYNKAALGNKEIMAKTNAIHILTAKLKDRINEKERERNRLIKERTGLIKEENKEIKKSENKTDKLKIDWKEVGNIIRNDVGEAIKGMMRGTKTLGEAALGILNKIADMFIDLAIQGMFTSLGKQGGFLGALFGAANGAHWKGGFKAFAQGGMVNEPTLGLVGEGGESEYIIPESKMSDAMNRYAAGARGDAVLAGGGGDVEGGGSGGAGGGSIDVRFTSERINDVSYVTFEQFQAGVQQAASEGAKRGEMSTLRRLQTSPSTRRRVGV